MKYRLLTKEELDALEEEFIKFLLIQNISMVEWESIKKKNQQKAHKTIEIFSDMIFEKIFSENQFLEKIEKNKIQALQFNDKNIQLFILESNEEDFIRNNLKKIDWNNCQLVAGKKDITENENREKIIFEHLENGFSLSKGDLFKKLALAYASAK